MNAPDAGPRPVTVFYSYAHEDEALREELEKHLSPLRREGIIAAWHDRDITAGSAWKDEIDQHLETAQLILLLISPDFVHSDYCYDIEMRRSLERHARGEAWVIPIHLRPVDWQRTPFAKLQALPTDAKPVSAWDDRDQAFKNIAQGIRQAAQEIRQTTAGKPIDHSDLTTLEGEPTRPRRKILLLAMAILLVAAGFGWYGYSIHANAVALDLDAGKRFLDIGEYQQARVAYEQAMAKTWLDTRATRLGLEKASVFDAADGEFHPTIVEERIRRILQQSPEDAHAYLFQGDLHASSDDYEGARKAYEAAIARDPDLAQGYFKLGVIHDKLGAQDEALAMHEQAVAHAPRYLPYLNNLAYQYLRNGEDDKAIATFKRALTQNGDFVINYVDLARYYRAHGHLEEAAWYLQDGVKRLDDSQIAALPINQSAWYFSVGDQTLRLDTPAQKQCYAYRSLAATLRTLQRTTEADIYQRKSCGLDNREERLIQQWVELEARHIGVERQSRTP